MLDLRCYILDADRTPRAVDVGEWRVWISLPANVTVGRTLLQLPARVCEISTVFLGKNTSHQPGPLVLYETLVFGLHDPDNGLGWRYCTWDDAMRGHEASVQAVMAQYHGRPME